MTILARLTALIGIILVVAAIVFLTKGVYDVQQQFNQLRIFASSRGNEVLVNPIYTVIWAAGLAVLGGLLAGLGLGLSTRKRAPVLHSQNTPGQK
ncbi:hypothetical protein Q0M94_05200 [Deinococcus radiomollis]|uniref:hypothetical protein n=1 Tax=Deinococcus radiomollis TaxID=468916 RepID=UPI0038911E03